MVSRQQLATNDAKKLTPTLKANTSRKASPR